MEPGGHLESSPEEKSEQMFSLTLQGTETVTQMPGQPLTIPSMAVLPYCGTEFEVFGPAD